MPDHFAPFPFLHTKSNKTDHYVRGRNEEKTHTLCEIQNEIKLKVDKKKSYKNRMKRRRNT